MDSIAHSLFLEIECYVLKARPSLEKEEILKDKLQILCFYASIEVIDELIEKLSTIQEEIDHEYRQDYEKAYDDNDLSTFWSEKRSRENLLKSVIEIIEKFKGE